MPKIFCFVFGAPLWIYDVIMKNAYINFFLFIIIITDSKFQVNTLTPSKFLKYSFKLLSLNIFSMCSNLSKVIKKFFFWKSLKCV